MKTNLIITVFLITLTFSKNIQAQEVHSTMPTAVNACESNTLSLTTSNFVNADFVIDVTLPTVAFNYHATLPAGFSVIRQGSVLKFSFDHTVLNSNPNQKIDYIIDGLCNAIPAMNAASATFNIIITTTATISGTLSTPFKFPFIDHYLLPNSMNFQIGVGQTQTVSHEYINNGSEDFYGSLVFDGAASIPLIVNITSVRFYLNNATQPFFTANGQGGNSVIFPINVDLLTIGINLHHGDHLRIEQDVFLSGATGCLPSGGLNTNFNLLWGCSCNPNKSTAALNVIFNNANHQDFVHIYRVSPIPFSSNQEFWDNSCTNTEQEWEFLISNESTNLTASDIELNLVNYAPLNTDYTYIDRASIIINDANNIHSFNYVNALAIPNNAVFSGVQQNNPFTNFLTAADQSFPPPACFQNDVFIKDWHLFVETLPPGHQLSIRFKTFRCCPDNVGFNNPIFFNHWAFTGKYKENCVDGYTLNTQNSTYTANNGQITNLYKAHLPTTMAGISTNSSIPNQNDPDLELIQSHQQLVTDLTDFGLNPSSNSCSEPEEYTIKNISFPNNDANDYDCQFFCASPNGSPGGVFKILFDDGPNNISNILISCPINGIPANSTAPYISNGTTNWLPTLGIEITNTGPHIVAKFDIATLQLNNCQEFKSFFKNSKLHFWVRGCCPLKIGPDGQEHGHQDLHVLTSFSQDCGGQTDCFINLNDQCFSFNVLCPGCVTPGILPDDHSAFRLERTNFGYQDDDDDGLADVNGQNITPIDQNYLLTHPEVDQLASIVGDHLRANFKGVFFDGTSDHSFGYQYSDWKTYWSALLNRQVVLKDMYYQINISNANLVNLQPTGGNVAYFQPNSVIPASIINLQNPVSVVSGNNVTFLYHVSAEDFLGLNLTEFNIASSVQFLPEFKICQNPANSVELSCTNSMFLTTNSLPNSIVNVISSNSGVSSAGVLNSAYFSPTPPNSVPTPPRPFISASPNLLVYFMCEGAGGAIHKVYSIKERNFEEWKPSNTCMDKLRIKTVRYVDADGAYNAFHNECRPLLMSGGSFSGLLNPAYDPVKLHLGSLANNFIPELVEFYTAGYSYSNSQRNLYAVSHVSCLGANNQIIPANGLGANPVLPANFELNVLNAQYSTCSELQSGILQNYNDPVAITPLCTFNTVQINNIPTLLLGDEYFEQGARFNIHALCQQTTSINSTYSVKGNDSYFEYNSYSDCQAHTSRSDGNIINGNYILSVPSYSNLEITNLSNTQTGSEIISDFAITGFPWINGFQGAENTNIYLQIMLPCNAAGTVNIPIPLNANYGSTDLSVTNVQYLSNNIWQTINPVTIQVNGSCYLSYDLQTIVNTPTKFRINFTLNGCTAADNLVPVPILYSWRCETPFPEINQLTQNTFCNNPSQFNFNLKINSVHIEAINSTITPGASNCNPVQVSACLNSASSGGIGNFHILFSLPDNYTPSNFNISSNNLPGGIVIAFPSNRITVVQNGNNKDYDVNLSSLNLASTSLTGFTAANLWGVDAGFGFNNNDGVFCIKFDLDIPCNTVTFPDLPVRFRYVTYCDPNNQTETISTFRGGPLVNGACHPVVTVSADLQAICPPQSATITATSTSLGSTFMWSNQANTSAISVGSSGAYSVTATAPNGCTASVTQNILPCQLNACGVQEFVAPAGQTYQWSFNNSPLNNSGSSLTPYQTGTYSVTVTQTNGSSASTSFNFFSPASIVLSGTNQLNNVITAQGWPTSGFSPAANTTIAIQGKLVINTNYNFSNVRFLLYPGANIIVNSNARLSVQNTTFESIGSCLWEGFHVNPNGGLTFGDRVQIQDAQYAVYLEHNSDLNCLYGSITFRDNFIGVCASRSSAILPAPMFSYSIRMGSNVRFEGTTNFKKPFPGMINETDMPAASTITDGDNMWAWAGIYLNLFQPTSRTALSAKFSNLANGAIVKHSSAYFRQCQFYAIPAEDRPRAYVQYNLPVNSGGTGARNGNAIYAYNKNQTNPANAITGINISNCFFKSCRKAIKIEQNYEPYIYNNIMNYCLNGIILNNCTESNITIQLNKIDMLGSSFGTLPTQYDGQGLSINFSEPWSTGVVLNFCRSGVNLFAHKIQDNTITVDKWPFFNTIQQSLNIANLGVGISISDDLSRQQPSLQITNNKVSLKNGAEGISMTNVSGIYNTAANVVVERNLVKANVIQATTRNAFRFSNCSNFDVLSNTAYGVLPGASGAANNTNLYPRGFCFAQNSGGHQLVSCNMAYGLKAGFRFEGQNSGTDFKTNDIGHGAIANYVGLHITTSGVMGKQKAKGNNWNGNYSSQNLAGWNQNSAFQGVPSQFRVPIPPGSSAQSPTTNTIIGPSQWFKYDPAVSVVPSCDDNNTTQQPLVQAGELTEFDEMVLMNQYHPDFFEEVNRWEAAKALQEKLGIIADTLDEESVERMFYDSVANTPLGKFAEVEHLQRELYTMNETAMLSLSQSVARQQSFAAALVALDSASNNDTTWLQLIDSSGVNPDTSVTLTDTTNQALYQRLQDYVEAERVIQQNIRAPWRDIFDQRRAHLLSALQALSTNANFQDYTKAVNLLYLKTIDSSNLQYEEGQFNFLVQLAQSCYLEAGNAVFNARAMLSGIAVESYDDFDFCDQAGIALKKEMATDSTKANENRSYRVYPIPANDHLVLYLYGGTYQGETVELINNLGEIVLRQGAPNGGNTLSMLTENLSPGFYQLRLMQADRIIYKRSVILWK
ncbi:MAG: hypothetical protein U0T73_09210 [Chitinophagales bacterium]